ncbi:MAG: 16S rRNA (guanine(527)-N(7))-methyltransferase RsmG [Gammaproteobacteria bacterium]|nr:16S rRNA (guanine(527)-N(7))-methyltransferase RsmG [Gammaproteobacteria bacterium]
MTQADRLAQGLAATGVIADGRALEQLAGWLALHQRWSRRINLTGPADADELIDRHLLDCARVLPMLPRGPLVDVGSGAGLPGLVVAIMEPSRSMFLLEILERRCAFLEQAALTLGLDNVSVVRARCEDWRPPVKLAGVLARAVAPLPKLLAMTAPLMADGTPLFAMKGPGWRDEVADLPAHIRLTGQEHYRLPGRDHDHVLLRLEQQVDDDSCHEEGG